MGLFGFVGEALFKGGSVGLVSRNIGYIYARLRDTYGDTLKDIPSLLLATATVDLLLYLQEGKVQKQDIVESIQAALDDAPSADEMAIFGSFVFHIQRLILAIHHPHVPAITLTEKLQSKLDVMRREAIAAIDAYQMGNRNRDLDDLIDALMK